MKTLCLLVLSLGLCLTVSVEAETTERGQITLLRGFNNGNIGLFVALDIELPNPAGCADTSFIRTGGSQLGDSFDQQFRMLLAAHMASRLVSIVIHDSDCVGDNPRFLGVILH